MPVKGLKIEKDAHGRSRKATFDMAVHGDILEDVIDNLIVDSRLSEAEISWETVKAREDKKRNVKKTR